MAPEPAQISNEVDSAQDTDDFGESSDFCDFGFVLVQRDSNPPGNGRDHANG